jgi:adenylyltransferase/sulfurtransferase
MPDRPETAVSANERYARQIILPEIGEAGQERLSQSSVLIVGLGGLGSPAALYLAASGIGRLALVEFDRVDPSNLHRQVLYAEADVEASKLEAAGRRLRAANSSLRLDLYPVALSAANARELIAGHDLVLDGTDNFGARYAINDACVLEGIPNVHAAVVGFEGQVTVLAHPDGPCYRCLFPDPPLAGTVPGCAEAGVLGVLPGLLGVMQATEALKLLLGIGEPLVGRMMCVDALSTRFREVRLARDPGCPVCGERPSIREVQDIDEFCAARGRPQERRMDEDLPFGIDVEELSTRIRSGSMPKVLDVRLPEELALASVAEDVVHIPLHLLPSRIEELDRGVEYAVLCHYGVRSAQAVQFLRQEGFAGARNVSGGIDRWSVHVDPAVPRY